ncbi:DUF4245 domain-containing protein [Kribbia dieselivorans]|uniref:DUF4245 domain-containing protein n=1 Tax=Kribbia dieselivorans TaxID=331526 RepID=UPI000837B854|nr:DUF4245 domain-containing protein [Kribbia dieselivorans]
MSAAPTDQNPTQGRVSHYLNGSLMNMVWSTLIVAGFVLVIVMVVPRTNNTTPEGIDMAAATQSQADRADRVLSYPKDLPSGWTATAERYTRSTDGLMMWHSGWTTPQNDFIAVQQVEGATDNWIEAQVQRSPRDGTWTDTHGQVWERYDRKDKVQHSLVLRSKEKNGRTSLVTGTGSWDDVFTFTNALVDVKPKGLKDAGASS